MDAMFSPQTGAAVAQARQHSVGDLLRRTAARYPDKLAVVAGDLRFTYAEFEAAANRTALALAARGLAKGDRLALLSHNSWQYAVLAFATAKLGVVLVPVNFMLGPDEIAFILRHSGAAGMVSEDALATTAASGAGSGCPVPRRHPDGRTSTTGGGRATGARRTPRWPTTTRCG